MLSQYLRVATWVVHAQGFRVPRPKAIQGPGLPPLRTASGATVSLARLCIWPRSPALGSPLVCAETLWQDLKGGGQTWEEADLGI